MLNRFRKIKKVCAVMITIMLLLPVQQSFSQSFSHMDSSSNENSRMLRSSSMDMEHCKSISTTNTEIDKMFSSESQQQGDCCATNQCDSSHCSMSISFIALFPNSDFVDSYEPQQHVIFVEHFEVRVLPSELFRPPRNIQI